MNIKCLDEMGILRLKTIASNMAFRFMAPVYLVGSALIKEDPLDLDIFLVLNERQYQILFGFEDEIINSQRNQEMSKYFHRWASFHKKQKAYFDDHSFGRDVDFKVQRWEVFMAHQGPKLRLDMLKDIF